MPLNAATANVPRDWPRDAATAMAVQQALRGRVCLKYSGPLTKWIAGLDVGYDPATNTSHAIGVMMPLDSLVPEQVVQASLPTEFPYIPGFLSFREVPVLLAALQKFDRVPDVLMVDGQGVAHPRRFGVASHLGVLANLPSIGVAKSKLCGHYHALGAHAGNTTLLYDREQPIGTALRSKANCLPLFVSAGHLMDQATALDITIRCLCGYRLPEPTRIADKYSKKSEREKPVPSLLV